jgi:pilus assembly protein TadC
VTAVVVAALVAAAVLVWPSSPALRLRRLLPDPAAAAAPEARGEPDEALLLDLVAAAVLAGAPTATALAVAGEAGGGSVGRRLRATGTALLLGAGSDEAWPDDPVVARLRRCLELSSRSGVPAVPLLRAAADTARRDRHRAGERAAARLGVQLALPLGLCAVPAFVAWGVVPVVLSLARQVGP